MENGEAHITKVINTVVKTRASLLGACNPIKGRFSEFEDLPQQVHLPPSLLSRFDLIVLLRDRPEERSDRKIAQHIADSHMAAGALMAGQPVSAEISDRFIPPITPDLLRKYIAYARKINPIITPVANKVLVDYYVKIRPNTDIGNTVAVTTRQQPSVIRLAEAHARMRLSKTVEEEDANAAISLFDACLKCVATDPATGKLDVDRVSNVSSAASRNIEDALINAINYVRGAAVSAKEEAVFERMSSLGYDSQKVRHHMDRLLREGKIMAPKNGLVKVM
jgi:replicative DNA helicase Mcm